MTKWSKIGLWVIGILLLVSVALTVKTCNQADKIDEQTGLLHSLNDTVKIWKDKEGKSHTSNSVITTQDPDDFIDMKGLKGENEALRIQVEKYKKQIKNGGSVTNFTSETNVSSTTPTKVDTVVIDNTRQAVYSTTFNKEGWVFGSVIARPDSTTVNVGTKDEYTVVIGEDRTGFLGLGKPIPFSEITNHNKYSTTPTLKTYKVDIKTGKNKWVLPAAVGVALGVVTTIIIKKQ